MGCTQPGGVGGAVTLTGQLTFQLLFRLKSTVGCPSSWKLASPGMNFFFFLVGVNLGLVMVEFCLHTR